MEELRRRRILSVASLKSSGICSRDPSSMTVLETPELCYVVLDFGRGTGNRNSKTGETEVKLILYLIYVLELFLKCL